MASTTTANNSGNGLGHPRVLKESSKEINIKTPPSNGRATDGIVSDFGQIGSDEERLLVKEDRKRGWREYSTLEKSLWIALVIVSVIAIAFITGVGVLGMRLNDEDEIPITKTPTTTLIPPWLTFAPPTPPPTTRTPPTRTTKPPGWNICSDESCLIVGAKIMEAMDKSVDPCDDFWQYSCGGWNNKNGIPDGFSQWDQFTVLSDQLTGQIRDILESDPKEEDPPSLTQAQNFYTSCTKQLQENKNDYTELETFVNSSLLSGDPVKNLGTIRRRLGENYVWAMYVDLDEMNTQNNVVYLDQPSLGIPQTYLIDPEDNDFVKAYTSLIEGIWTAVYPGVASIPTIAADIVKFEKSLALISTEPEDRRNKTELYNPMPISDLVGTIEWKTYLEEVFHDISEFESWTETVIVRDLSFFSQIDSIFTDPANQDTIRNYLKWRIIFNLVNDVSSELQELMFKFSSVTQGLLAPPSLWKYCSQKSNSLFGFALSYEYLRLGLFTKEQKDEVNDMVENVRKAFVSRLTSPEMSWIVDDTTKTAAQLKATAMTAKIGFPDWLATIINENTTESYTILDYYEDLELQDPENHLQNVIDVLEWSSVKQLATINGTKEEENWSSVSTILNTLTKYSATTNSLTFPAAILQLPFHGMPLQYLNYGSIGALLGHEFIHGFDATDRQNDPNGDLVNWFDDETDTNYVNKTQCFVEQYNNYTIQNGKSVIPLNGEMTLDANIAEVGGLNLAFKAYELYMVGKEAEKLITGLDTLTVQQMFFVSYAQTFCGTYADKNLEAQVKTANHVPHQFRVRGALANSQIFKQTWKCDVYTEVEEEMCELW